MDTEQRYFLRCASVEEAPPVPDIPDGEGPIGDLELEVDLAEIEPRAVKASLLGLVPELIQVSGCCARAAYPALSPRSGMMKRKDGDHLGINGVYALREEPHNDSPCWVQQPFEGRVEVWHIFRSRDRASWVIDSMLHGADREDAVAARLTADVEDPTAASASWVPMPSLKLAPITPASFDCLARGPGGYLGGSIPRAASRRTTTMKRKS
ncbi:unnamed protein product [Symbiodinium necroappetens]|uniref:Uncharacterized protein n=1 Tax=Symbiodinium necroappetens TaxID=1628268 RepID=A0A812LUJ6_9DINO|nr:unnamed protein product [Symbiodinium necroappetens]CAE7353989.1 unnamed protein product [Symbiodinium sp. KB8]